MRIIVDRDRCVAAGQCVAVADAVFDQDDDGIAIVLQDDVAEEEISAVTQAALVCPASAIVIEG